MSATTTEIAEWTTVQFVSTTGPTYQGVVTGHRDGNLLVEITGQVIRPGHVEDDPDFVRDIGVTEVVAPTTVTVL